MVILLGDKDDIHMHLISDNNKQFHDLVLDMNN